MPDSQSANSFQEGHRLQVQCRQGYELEGSVFTVCRRNGSWTNTTLCKGRLCHSSNLCDTYANFHLDSLCLVWMFFLANKNNELLCYMSKKLKHKYYSKVVQLVKKMNEDVIFGGFIKN